MQNLSEIKTKNSGAYHKLMHGLYLHVMYVLFSCLPSGSRGLTGSSGTLAGSSEAVDAMDYLDVDGMT